MEIVRLDLRPFSELRLLLEPLVAEASAEGFRFLSRLAADFESGENQFADQDEALFGVLVDGRLVAVGGLNVDPHAGDPFVGRVRRVYVSARYRRQGIGRMLVERVVEAALSGRFTQITLRTDNELAARFYDSLGFERVERSAHTTHRLVVRAPRSG